MLAPMTCTKIIYSKIKIHNFGTASGGRLSAQKLCGRESSKSTGENLLAVCECGVAVIPTKIKVKSNSRAGGISRRQLRDRPEQQSIILLGGGGCGGGVHLFICLLSLFLVAR
jgi:hypothetical protein